MRRMGGGEGGRRVARGSTLIEFALVLPFFLILLFGTVEFGRYFLMQHTLQFATREGARLGLVGRTVTDANGRTLDRAASIVQTIRDKARVAMSPSDVTVSIFPVNADYSDPSGWQTSQNAGTGGSMMRVRTRYTFHPILPLLGTQIPMQAQATYRNETF
jgi:Flp pilus assembly protein TadG